MTTRQPLRTLSPPTANILNTRYARIAARSANGTVTMEEQIQEQEDMQEAASVVSGLSSLENDAEDDFEKLMIQNARDERRLNQALGGRVQAFRKARTHPRVGLTMDSLERNQVAAGANAHVKFESPPSSSGSTRSDPAIHAPPGWGRKSRSNRNWMRTITYEEQQQTPVAADDTLNGDYERANDAHDANVPRRSVEDSPLSHKSSVHGTPRNDRSADWDLTFELNEASMIASTPYVPRNTALDEIRQREIETLKEQAVTTARLDRIRGGSPELRRPRSSSAKSIQDGTNESGTNTGTVEQTMQSSPSPQKRLRTRTKSWQSIGKSQPVTGIGKEDSPVAMYKSAENIATVSHEAAADPQSSRPKRIPHRREDSQDLLRRLARVSNTPSPGRVAATRPQTAPPAPLNSSSQTMVVETEHIQSERKDEPKEMNFVPDAAPETGQEAPDIKSKQDDLKEEAKVQEEQEVVEKTQNVEGLSVPIPDAAAEDENIDATPMPAERSIMNPKTPVVTGAWVDTPGPRTARRATSRERSRSRSPQKCSPRKGKLPERPKASIVEVVESVAVETVRPQLPSSALHALVQEAKSQDRRQSADFGDSTINSLEDLITPLPGSPPAELDEDTLQGLQLPTVTPRNDAERQRQQELVHLHRMNDRLRAARTSIRDASRGMKRVEDQVEHVEEGENGTQVRVIHRACPCATGGAVQHDFSLWKWWKSFFWQERIKTLRQASDSRWKVWGGLTGLGIFLVVFFTWLISEEIACEIHCHHMYAQSSPYPFSVNMNAPKYPFVIPTLIYRTLIKGWWLPIYSFFSWIVATMWSLVFGLSNQGAQTASHISREGSSGTATAVNSWRMTSQAAQIMDELDWDAKIEDDEILQGARAGRWV